jgi:glycosyltransferase involved in cell wall biosynthesis
MNKSKVYVALPVLNESASIPDLLDCLQHQEMVDFKIVVCVNQYDDWWEEPGKSAICIDNRKSLDILKDQEKLDLHIIDKSSPGQGWKKKKGGVGWARKVAMDFISDKAQKNDIIVSIDADTFYPPDYLRSITDFFNKNDSLTGLSIPYYHKLDDKNTSRLILRYEIYMRYYLLNMFRINNPYCFTALGSAMAFPVWAYRKAGGLTPVAAGEDFYFLQKLVKIGTIGLWIPSMAYPSSRFSNRVSFGTGPALIKGDDGDWKSYPHYQYDYFDQIKDTYSLFGELFTNYLPTPMDDFLKEQSKSKELWEPLKRNYKDICNFEKACVNKVDGLRILQFLRKQQMDNHKTDEQIIFNFLSEYYNDKIDNSLLSALGHVDYLNSDIKLLSNLRDFLFNEEMKIRKSRLTNVT